MGKNTQRAQVGDVIRITPEAFRDYFQCVIDTIPSDSSMSQDYRALKDAELIVERLYEESEDHPPVVCLVSGGWQVIEHRWYEIVK